MRDRPDLTTPDDPDDIIIEQCVWCGEIMTFGEWLDLAEAQSEED